jgi:PBSX family phage terminase large subunit
MDTPKKSTPGLTEFNPLIIPFQGDVIHDIDLEFDYSKGTQDVLLSGSVGSAKSLLAAHLAVRHCIMYDKARLLIARRTLPDLKETLFALIVEHLQEYNEDTESGPMLVEGKDYWVRENVGQIRFRNGSQIMSRSWADKKYKKLRSLALSAAIIEELTENDEQDSQAFFELRQRIGRLPHIKEKWLLCCTNPDSPRHWAYKYFFQSEDPNRHVYMSRTEDNPFLAPEYIEGLKRTLDPKQARRMLYGEWIEIETERIYYAYDDTKNFIKKPYKIDLRFPIALCFDFNIGVGKPMSAAVGQYINDEFHFFDEVIVEGARTYDILEEMAARGIFEHNTVFKVYGDATGVARSTTSIHSNYDQIKMFLSNYDLQDGRKLRFEMHVPRSNPPIRERHNIVNGYCMNVQGKARMFVYSTCPVLDEGMRLTALKKGANYVEDDSPAYQHVTTSVGYFIVYESRKTNYAASLKKAGL